MKTTFTELAALAVAVSLFGTGPALTFSPNQNRPPQIRPQAPPQVVRPTIRPMVQVPAVTDRVGRLHQKAAANAKNKSVADKKRRKTNVATSKTKQDNSKNKRSLKELAAAPSQNLKKAAGQSGLAHVAEPMPPLPLRNPMAGANESKGSVSLTASLPDVSAEPQPEPPTDGSDAIDATIKDIFRRIGSPELPGEIARLGDLKEILGGNGAIDDGSIGGSGSKRPGYADWLGLVPESNTGDPEPHDHMALNPENMNGGGSGADPKNPDGQDGESWQPPHRNGANHPGFGQIPGNADTGMRFGRGGETSQDGEGGEGGDSEESDGNPPETIAEAREVARNCATDCDVFTTDTRNGARAVHYAGNLVIVTTYFHNSPIREHWYNSRTGEFERYMPPGSQPNPDEPLDGQSLPCPATHRDCGPSADTVSQEDLVSQPGKGDDDASAGGFKASIAERKGVVTQPNPEGHTRTGRGGSGSGVGLGTPGEGVCTVC